MRRSGGFIWGRSSDWTRIGLRFASSGAPHSASLPAAGVSILASGKRDNGLADARLHGHSAETPHQARSETYPYAVAAAGDQTVADVDAGALGPSESGDGREPDARRGSDRGSPRSEEHTSELQSQSNLV